MENELNEKDDSPLDCGGDIKECELLNDLGLNVECQSQNIGKDIVKQEYALKNNLKYLKSSRILKIGESTFGDFRKHMIKRQRLTEKRTDKLLTTAGTMSRHIQPVNFFNPNPDNFINHMDYREEIEQVHPSVLKYEWIVMQKILTAFGINFGEGTDWYYKPPSIPPPKPRFIPLPDEMYNITHYKYTDNKLLNVFLQYSLTLSCILGWRNPSELCIQKISDIDLDIGQIIITEKKKHNKKRKIIPDYKDIINSKQVKSLKNWIEIWRQQFPRIKEFDDYLFVRHTDGKPLSEMQYTRLINYYVNPIFLRFSPGTTRHYCATGILIREYINTKHWNEGKVKRYLGHENINNTIKYTKDAEQLIKIAPYDWFKRILRQPRNKLEENTLKSTSHKKTFVSGGNSPGCSEISERKQILYK
jgi:integrase